MQNKLQKLVIVLIFVVLIFLRFWRLDQPKQMYFDEIYHVSAARQIVNQDPRFYEWWHLKVDGSDNFDWLHPPLAKYVQAFFMNVLGDNALGWRTGSGIFGLGVILFIFLVSQELFENKKISLIASFLAACEGLLLVQSRIAMNDIYLSFFVLLILFFYLKFFKDKVKANSLWLLATGMSMGLALATKWSALLIIVLIWILEIISFVKQKNILRKIPWRFFCLVIMPFVIYFIFYLPILFLGKNLNFIFDLHQNIIWYHFNRDDFHSFQSTPMQWFLNLRPVWYFKGEVSKQAISNIYALGNPLVFLFGLVSVFFSLVSLKNINRLFKLLLLAFFSLWLPWIFSPRIMFFYHYTPAAALLCILISYWLFKLNKNNLTSILLLIFLVFLIYYPHWTGLSVSKSFAEAVYFILPSWK
jgi:dolichyl-phosphate-mannose-protein mannosyltransferase